MIGETAAIGRSGDRSKERNRELPVLGVKKIRREK